MATSSNPGAVAVVYTTMRGAFGDLLYVGRSIDPGPRFGKHARDKDWWRLVRKVELHHCVDEDQAALLERQLIGERHPPLNVIFNRGIAIPWRCSWCEGPLAWREIGMEAVEIDGRWFAGAWYCGRCRDYDSATDPPRWAVAPDLPAARALGPAAAATRPSSQQYRQRGPNRAVE